MKALVLLVALTLSLLVALLATEAQPPGTVHRIGYLSPQSPAADSAHLDEFRDALHDLGYVDGTNMVMEYRFAEGQVDRLPALAAELVRLQLDVIITSGTLPTRALQDATTTIPIVVTSAGDLVGRGLVASLARPGGNITGSTSIAPDLSGKRLEILKEVVPRVARVAFLYQPYEADEWREIQRAAHALGVQMQRLEMQQESQFPSAYAAMTQERADVLLISRSPFTHFHRRQLIDLAVTHRLPAMCDGIEWTNDGCLMSYAPDRTEGYRRAAVYVDKIRKGTKPADLPVVQPTKFELVINLRTAKTLGLTIPPTLLFQADKVIQ